MTRFPALALLLFLVSCQGATNDAEMIATAKEAASSQAGIPSSATFRSVRLSEDDDDAEGTVCGEVRANSADGTDVDFTRFIYSPTIKQAVVAYGPRPSERDPDNVKRVAEFRASFEKTWNARCT